MNCFTKLRAIKKLQERFNVFLGCKVLESEKKENLFKAFVLSAKNIKDTVRVMTYASCCNYLYSKESCRSIAVRVVFILNFFSLGTGVC